MRVTVRAADDGTRQDPHDTTIDFAVVPLLSAARSTPRSRARVDALVVDDDSAGIVVIESTGGSHARRGRHGRQPGPGDSYALRLTLRPNGTVTVALLTDGQTDVVAGGRISYQAIAGGLFTGAVAYDAGPGR